MELLREALTLERDRGVFLGIVPSLVGERGRLLDLPALSTVGP